MDNLTLIRKSTKEKYNISKAYLKNTPNGEVLFVEIYQSDKMEKDFFGNDVYYNLSLNDIKEYFDIEE